MPFLIPNQTRHARLFAACVLLGTSSLSQAAIVDTQAMAYGLEIDVGALFGLVQLEIPASPQVAVGGTNPATQVDSLVSMPNNAILNLGLLETGVSTTGNAFPQDSLARARTEVVGLGLNVLGLLGLELGTIVSEARVAGEHGQLGQVLDETDTGTRIVGLGVDVLGGSLIDLNLDPAENFELDVLGLLGITGLDIVLNETFHTCDYVACGPDDLGTEQRGVERNAVHISLNGGLLGGLGVVSGDIWIGHAEAELIAHASPVPVPAAAWLLISGLAGLGLLARRQQGTPDRSPRIPSLV